VVCSLNYPAENTLQKRYIAEINHKKMPGRSYLRSHAKQYDDINWMCGQVNDSVNLMF